MQTIHEFHDHFPYFEHGTREDAIDPITRALRDVQKPVTSYLWTPDDAITFTPAVHSVVYGDGRALFWIETLEQRPAYWIIRGDSSWTTHRDAGEGIPNDAIDFAEICEEILCNLEAEFGRAEADRDFYWDAQGRPRDLETKRFLPMSDISYPVVLAEGGLAYGRHDWPDLPGVALVPHPFRNRIRILVP